MGSSAIRWWGPGSGRGRAVWLCQGGVTPALGRLGGSPAAIPDCVPEAGIVEPGVQCGLELLWLDREGNTIPGGKTAQPKAKAMWRDREVVSGMWGSRGEGVGGRGRQTRAGVLNGAQREWTLEGSTPGKRKCPVDDKGTRQVWKVTSTNLGIER